MAISNFRNTLGPGDESSNVVSSSSSAIDRSDTTSECSSNNGLPDEPNSIAHRVQVPIAVVGMACRLPGHSNSPRDLWEFLERGGIAENEPPTSRFSLSAHHDKDRRPRTMKSPGGMFMEDVDPELFDAQFFSTSRVDATAMDPQQRQLLEVTYECLENGGIPMEKISGKKIGCLVGANAVGMSRPFRSFSSLSIL